MNNRKKIIYTLLICILVNNAYAFAEKKDSIKEEIESNKKKMNFMSFKKRLVNIKSK